ncbi:MAG TPA: single-stranded-DNA-specific exonuclease RecJ, partial [Chloroflexi bacterium]|nr:single-stranded-DNA-specific exonuclease RecJ [Chloroflexota bacterium]
MSPEPIPKRWYLASPAPPEHMARFPQLSPIIVQLLYNRGITDPASVHTFLNGSNDTNPFKLPGLPDAITRLRQALRAGERIVVYGDFDTDGVTATALLVQTLRALGGRVKP